MPVRRILFLTVAVCLVIAATAGIRRLRPVSPPRTFRVVERLVDRVSPEPDPVPGRARHHWTAIEIEREWTTVTGDGAVMFRSPELALDAADEVDVTVVTLPPSRERVLLLWNDAPTFSRSDLLRNRRELFPSLTQTTRVAVRGEDIGADTLNPVRHLFIHLPAGTELRAAISAIEVYRRSDRLNETGSGRVRFASAGELRDAVYTRPGEAIDLTVDVPKDALLSIGLRTLEPSGTAAARISFTTQGRETKVFDRRVTGSTWQEVRVPLLAAVSARLRFDVGRQAPSTVVWANPSILSPDNDARPNVVLYVVDALRADRLGLYGAKHSPSPFLDELSRGSLVFRHAYAAASWTKPSVTSLLTALHPQTHSVGARVYTDALPDGARTLQDDLRGHGYLTAQFSANPLSATLSNLDQGFDEAFGPEAFAQHPGDKIRSETLNEKILPWLRTHRGDRFFLYVQSLDPHGPLAATGAGARDPYDVAIEGNDRQLRRLYERLIELGLDRQTLFIVTSDHGEAFGEHGRTGHGQSVYEEEVHVPLMMRLPGVLKPARVEQPVSLVDLLPSILNLCGVVVDRREIQGNTLPTDARTRGSGGPIFVSSFVYPEDVDVQDRSRVQATAIIDFPWKLIVTAGGPGGEPRLELYDLQADPGERRNLAAASADRAGVLRAQLRQFLANQEDARRQFAARYGQPNASRPRRTVSPDVLEQLKGLGYVR